MSRVQLALNVSDLEAAVDFYTRLLGVEPHKRRPGYANFAVDDPPLKLVLFENPQAGGTLNHLGVEVAATAEVAGAASRLAGEGLAVETREQELCCHATQDKAWLSGPDGEPWEVYAVTDDAPDLPVAADLPVATVAGGACCD